jgi:hypothetical protein
MRDTLKTITAIGLIVALVYGGYRWDFYIWRLKHPTTPEWVFFVP